LINDENSLPVLRVDLCLFVARSRPFVFFVFFVVNLNEAKKTRGHDWLSVSPRFAIPG
jgi:hypothetical protein